MSEVKAFSNKMYLMSFLCTVLVVYIHVFNLETYNIQTGVLFHGENFITNYLARMAVPFFFISSSFWTFSKKKRTILYYKSKIISLVIPYLSWNTISMIFFFVLTCLSLSNVGIVENFNDFMQGLLFYKYNYVYWFMYQLILLSALYPIIRCFLKSKTFSISLFLFLILIYQCLGEIRYGNMPFLQIEALTYYFFGAILGSYYSENIINFRKNEKLKLLLFSFISLIIIAIVETLNLNVVNNLEIIKNIFLIIFVFFIFDYIFPKQNKKYFKYSFMIYSSHSLILECIEKLIYIFLPHNNLIAFMDYIFAPILTIIIIYVLCYLFDNLKIYKILSGERY